MQAVEYYNAPGLGGMNGPDAQYKSLGIFGKESPPRDAKKAASKVVSVVNTSTVKTARSVQNMAERSFSVSVGETLGQSNLTRTPHRTAGYGGAGHPNRAPHRFGNPDMRASYTERSRQRNGYSREQVDKPGIATGPLYKSNSSLDLDNEVDILQESSVIQNASSLGRREYGSHGSLDVMGRDREALMAMFPSTTDGPAAVSTLTRPVQSTSVHNRSEESAGSVVSNGSLDVHPSVEFENGGVSPKQKKKAIGFWGKDKSSRKSQKSLFKKRVKEGSDIVVKPTSETSSDGLDNRAEDKHRRRFFSHHDIGSVCASLSVTAQLRTLQRRNTTTGASAASAALRSSGPSSAGSDSPENEDQDQGDGISNELVLSCPYFRNEVGGDSERNVALTRETGRTWQRGDDGGLSPRLAHLPRLARGFCLLEHQSTHWKAGICPYSKTSPNTIERIDAGSTYYKNYFYGQEHQNWFGVDENLGPVAVSIRRERVPPPPDEGFRNSNLPPTDQHMYRIIVRTSELLPLRGTVLEDSIPALKSEKIKSIPTKEVLEFTVPELNLSGLHLGVQSGPCEDQLVRLDEQCSENTYKVGVMFCRVGQQSEEDMYNNEEGGASFNEFLDVIGQRVRLKGFNKYKAGLCNKNDSTGLYSVYREFETNEIMFHVSTLLPYTPNNRQQLPRKRHIGNDIVTVVFQEPGALPFIPNIRSQFQHVFIIVRAHNPCTENTQYSIAVTRSKNVPMFGPPIPTGALFPKGPAFAKFLLTKIINAENAAHRSDKFVSMATRTRQEYLKDLAANYITQTTIDSGSKFALFAPKKKSSLRPRFSPDASLRGALSWTVVIEDCGTNQQMEAYLAVSSDSLVVIQDNNHHDILFVAPCKSILGWTATHNSIRIFYHQGECVILHSKDWEADDMHEISARLKSVTPGAPCQEFTLRRNQIGQLGFHVQHDGLITEVENFGYAWQTGLRQGSRLVEICRHPVTTLTHEQMVELLKTSMTVVVTVIPPHPDGSPRRGCNLHNCSYAFGGFEGDYENVSGEGEKAGLKPGTKQAPSCGKLRYERSLSPPRSSNSSGYGTGSSSKSCVERFPGETMTSSSSDERWYDFMDQPPSTDSSPPPLPTRIGSKTSAFQKVPQNNRNTPNSDSVVVNNPKVSPNPKGVRGQDPVFSNYATPPSHPHLRPYSGYESASSSDTVKSSSTLQLQENNATQPLEERRSVEARSTYLTEYELTQGEGGSPELTDHYLQHERLSALKSTSLPPENRHLSQHSPSPHVLSPSPHVLSPSPHITQPPQLSQPSQMTQLSPPPPLPQQLPPSQLTQYDTGHNTDTSSSASNVRSEDEQSGVHSPHRPRQGGRRLTTGTTTPSSTTSTGSRGHSPKTVTTVEREPAKKKVSRSARNSANLASSTLQEDLMKLISPDFEDMPPPAQPSVQDSPLSKLPKKTLSELSLMKSRSGENIAKLEDNVSAEVSFHMARPATVISNTSSTSSPASEAAKNIPQVRDESSRASPHVSSVHIKTSPPKPAAVRTKSGVPEKEGDMDWSSLVDTATKAMFPPNEEEGNKEATPQAESVRTVGGLGEAEVRNLLERVQSLEQELDSESRRKEDLEEEVVHLREENVRLQEESKTAAQQLRRFTEWFFQTIDKS